MNAATRLGQVLFRFRSVTPLPVLAVLAWLLWRSRAASMPTAVVFVGPLISMAGQVLRFYTVSRVPEGTSGQDDVLEARVLNTKGPYARVRNPLYVGNLLLCVGLMSMARDPWVALIGLAFFFGEYFFIIRAEENFLRESFGAAFDAYVQSVPRWVPRLSAASTGRLREGGFDWKRGLKKEHNPFAAWTLGALALLAWQSFSRGAPIEALWPHAAVAAAVLVGFVSIKAWKRGWLR